MLLAAAAGLSTLSVVLGLWILHVTAVPQRLVHMLDVNSEGSFSTWWSVLQLAAASTLAVLLARRSGADAAARRGFWTLAGGLALASVDEEVQFHEAVSALMARTAHLDAVVAPWALWVLPGAVIVLVLAMLLLPTVRRLPSTVRRTLVLGASVYVGSAVVLEGVSGFFADSHPLWGHFFVMQLALEEFGEMAGVALLITALYMMLLDFHLAPERAASPPASHVEPSRQP